MILIPGTSHQITWSVQNLSDTTTYYVRAVIRDIRTETTLATINLTDLGNGRFSKSWNVPQDPTGFGREIEIEKTVYEDSGYTTVSDIYGRFLDQYTVFNIANRLPSSGGSGGHSIDYREIAKIIKKEVSAAVEILKTAENEEDNSDTKVIDSIQKLQNKLMSALEDKGDTSIEEAKEEAHMAKLTSVVNGLKEAISYHQDSVNKSISNVLAIVSKELKQTIEDLAPTNEKNAEAMDNYMAGFETRLDKAIGNISKKLEMTVTDQTKKLEKAVSDAMSKPLNVTLAANTVPQQQEKVPSPREQTIKKMLGHE